MSTVRPLRAATAVAAALVLLGAAGCAGPRPDAPADSAVTAPATWRDGRATSADAPRPDWWTGFGDAALNALVAEAYEHNDDLAMAIQRVRQARAQYRITGADLLPHVDLEGGIARERALTPFGVPDDDTARSLEVRVSYEIDLFGRIATATAAQRALLLASQASRDTVRLSVASTVVSGYLQLRALDARLDILHSTLDARADSLKYAQRREGAGYATKLELAQAEAEYRSTSQQIPAAELSIRRQENALCLVLGQPPGPIARGRSLDDLALLAVPTQVPSQVLRQRPDIAQAEQQLVAADRSLDVARDNFLPRFSLSLTKSRVDSTLIDGPYNLWSLGGSVLAPLFEGGRLRAAADVAAAQRDQAAYAYRKAALASFREVEDALASVQRSGEQEAEIALQVEALERAQHFADQRYHRGYATYLEFLDAERGVLAAQLSRVQSRNDRLAATVSLFQSLGGGWSPEE